VSGRVSGPARLAFCLLLGLPAAVMLVRWRSGDVLTMDLLHPTGELSIRLMVLAMLPGPLLAAFPGNRFLRSWIALRRYLGVAAFGYGMLHLAAYVVDMGQVVAIVEELALPGIWTGWLAIALLTAPAAISHDRIMRAMGRNWKRVQRLVYAAFVLALVHWVLLDRAWGPAAVHCSPLLAAWSLRAWCGARSPRSQRSSA
jgi:sulfoxide reductase heme-binding subunit YedZ